MSVTKLLEDVLEYLALCDGLRAKSLAYDINRKLEELRNGKDYTSAESALVQCLDTAINEIAALNAALIDSNTELDSCYKVIKDGQTSLESWQRAYYAIVNKVNPPTLN